MQLHRPISVIGWGDVPADKLSPVSNEVVKERIVSRLQRLALTSSDARQEMERICAMTSESITDKFGISERQYYSGYNSTELATIAAERAIAVAEQRDRNFRREKIALVFSGGSTPEDLYPGPATQVQSRLGIPDAECSNISDACCSGTQALIHAIRALQVGNGLYGLVTVGESIGSRANDFSSEHSFLWGDGGGALIVGSESSCNRNYGFLNFLSRGDGQLASTTRSIGIGLHPDHRRMLPNASMEGRHKELFRWVSGTVANQLNEFLVESRVAINNRTFLIPHAGHPRMGVNIAEKCGIDKENILSVTFTRGNQSSASVLSTIAHYADGQHFQKDDLLVIVSFGGGVNCNFLLYRWP